MTVCLGCGICQLPIYAKLLCPKRLMRAESEIRDLSFSVGNNSPDYFFSFLAETSTSFKGTSFGTYDRLYGR